MKNVQFGCGGNYLPDFINHDIDCNISELPLPYADASVDFIFAEHVCEHITTHQFLHFLGDCWRILKPGGTLRIVMPVLNKLSVEAARDIILNHGHLSSWTPELIAFFIRAAGFNEADIRLTDRREGIDGHWKVIGKEKDDLESARLEATK